jgi:hypothetical protein
VITISILITATVSAIVLIGSARLALGRRGIARVGGYATWQAFLAIWGALLLLMSAFALVSDAWLVLLVPVIAISGLIALMAQSGGAAAEKAPPGRQLARFIIVVTGVASAALALIYILFGVLR